MKTKLRRIMLASVLIAGIVGSTYGIFARANAASRLASQAPKSPARGQAKAGSAALAVRTASGANTAAGGSSAATASAQAAVPMVQASYSSLADGQYVGTREYAYYGYVQVEVVVQNGTISNVKVLEHPNDNGTSRYINSIAVPYLVQEAVQAQNTQISLISGATLTSVAFVRSLDTAITKAASA